MAAAGLTERSRFLRFLAVGGFAAAVNVGARWLLNHAMSYNAAIVLSYLIGMVTAYLLSRMLVFERSSLSAPTEFLRFGLVNVAAVIQVWLVSVGLAEWFFPWIGLMTWRYDIAHVIGVAVPTVTSYLGHKHFSFVSRGHGGSLGDHPMPEQAGDARCKATEPN